MPANPQSEQELLARAYAMAGLARRDGRDPGSAGSQA